jgi:hypothetical protein
MVFLKNTIRLVVLKLNVAGCVSVFLPRQFHLHSPQPLRALRLLVTRSHVTIAVNQVCTSTNVMS